MRAPSSHTWRRACTTTRLRVGPKLQSAFCQWHAPCLEFLGSLGLSTGCTTVSCKDCALELGSRRCQPQLVVGLVDTSFELVWRGHVVARSFERAGIDGGFSIHWDALCKGYSTVMDVQGPCTWRHTEVGGLSRWSFNQKCPGIQPWQSGASPTLHGGDDPCNLCEAFHAGFYACWTVGRLQIPGASPWDPLQEGRWRAHWRGMAQAGRKRRWADQLVWVLGATGELWVRGVDTFRPRGRTVWRVGGWATARNSWESNFWIGVQCRGSWC